MFDLFEFERVSDSIINLSPYDGSNLPSVSFYPNFSCVIDMEEDIFQTLLETKLNKMKVMILSDRAKKMQRASNGC